MLRRIWTLIAAVTMIGICALPASASTSAAHAATHKFTMPTIKHHNVVQGWGTFTKINSERVVVTVCVKQTGSAFAVGAVAVVSKPNGSTKNIGAVIIGQGKGATSCDHMSFVFYTAHLRVHTFIAQGGKIIATSSVKKIY